MREDSGGGGFSKEKPLPRAPSRREGRTRGCEGGGFSKRSPSLALPPEEWLGINLTFLLVLCAHARWGQSPICLVMVTAADRAVATFAAWEQALYKKKALTFCQNLLLVYARTKRLPPQRELSAEN